MAGASYTLRAALTVPSRELRKTGSSRAVTRGWVVSRLACRSRPAPALQSPLPLVALRPLALCLPLAQTLSFRGALHFRAGSALRQKRGVSAPKQPALPEQDDPPSFAFASSLLEVGAT